MEPGCSGALPPAWGPASAAPDQEIAVFVAPLLGQIQDDAPVFGGNIGSEYWYFMCLWLRRYLKNGKNSI